jgi:hypothetical protein
MTPMALVVDLFGQPSAPAASPWKRMTRSAASGKACPRFFKPGRARELFAYSAVATGWVALRRLRHHHSKTSVHVEAIGDILSLEGVLFLSFYLDSFSGGAGHSPDHSGWAGWPKATRSHGVIAANTADRRITRTVPRRRTPSLLPLALCLFTSVSCFPSCPAFRRR